ncbi:MAG: flippase-like domain-containing protein [Calditrichota bacterium]
MRVIFFFLIVSICVAFITQGFISQVDILPVDNIMEILSNSYAMLLGAAFVINLCLFLLFSLRWRLMISPGSSVSLQDLVFNRLIGFAVSYLTPGNQIGGEPLQIALLSKRNKFNFKQATEVVLMERGVDFIANGLIVILLTVTLGTELLKSLDLSAATLAFFLFTALVAILAIWYFRDKLAQLSSMQRFSMSLGIRLGIYSLLIWLLLLLEFWLLFAAVGFYLPATQLLLLFLAVRLAFWIPIPIPAAAGVMESALITAAGICALPIAHALAVALLIRLRDLFFIAAGLILFWIESGRWLFSVFSSPLSTNRGVELE